MTMLRYVAVGLVLAAAAPALAQAPDDATGRRAAMVAGMSEPGQQIMLSAMGGREGKAERMRVQAARDHMLDILDDDRLDVPALRRAMEDERTAVSAQQARRHAAMLGAFQQLSVADRKAFVAGTRTVRARFEQRADDVRERRLQRMGVPAGAPPPP